MSMVESPDDFERLAMLKFEHHGLTQEGQELQRLIEEARILCERAEELRSRPASAAKSRAEEDLQAEHNRIVRRSIQCSRPSSAAGSTCSSARRSSIWKKPTSRPMSAKAVAASVPMCPVLLSPTSTSAGPRELAVEIDRSAGESLGMKIRTHTSSLEITKVKDDGLLAQWNMANPSALVRKGDRIIEVNGVRGTGDALYQECMKEAILQLVVECSMSEPMSPMTPMTPMTPAAPTPESCRRKIVELLHDHDRAALGGVDKLMDEWKGREVALYERLRRKFGVPATTMLTFD